MRKLLEGSQQKLLNFVRQRQRLISIVRCADASTAFTLKMLSDIDAASGEDLFVLLGGTFRDSQSYVDDAVVQLGKEHELASQAVVESGRPPLSPMPDELRDPRRSPQERLRGIARFAHDLLPPEGRRFVIAIVPEHLANRTEYLKLLTALVPGGAIESWMRRGRFVLRDEPQVGEGAHPLAALAPELFEILDLDFGPSAMEAAMVEEAGDDSRPMAERMQSLLGLAVRDAAFGRATPAMEKLACLLSYFQTTHDVVMQAFVMNTMGDVFGRAGSTEEAEKWYECALGAAAEGNNVVVLAMVSKNLGSLCYAKGNYVEAEQYFDGLDRIATHMLDADTRAWALEWRGMTQEKMGRIDDAIASWEAAVTLSRNTDQPDALRANLEHLRKAYPQATAHRRARAAAPEEPLPNSPIRLQAQGRG